MSASSNVFFSRDSHRENNYRFHFHSRHELYYLTRGTAKYMVAEKTYRLQPGNIIFIPAGALHGTDYEGNREQERLLLYFPDDVIPPMFQKYIRQLSLDTMVHVPPEHQEEMGRLMANIEEEWSSPSGSSREMVILYLLQLLVFVHRHCQRGPAPGLPPHDELMGRIARYIQQNFHTNVSLDSLSERFFISKSHLSKKFKREFGLGINEYITYIRIVHAEQLLTAGDLSVTQIAKRCGYGDSNYFSTLFKKFKGVTPFQFRRQIAAERK